jgi:hypothetical protein
MGFPPGDFKFSYRGIRPGRARTRKDSKGRTNRRLDAPVNRRGEPFGTLVRPRERVPNESWPVPHFFASHHTPERFPAEIHTLEMRGVVGASGGQVVILQSPWERN